MLWLALHFRHLALEVFSPDDCPVVVVQQQKVVAANTIARAVGIFPGMRLSLALGLAPKLAMHERAKPREARALYQLACWAGQFSPHVSMAGEEELLLEIGGCLRLFGGLEALCQQVHQGVTEQGFLPCMAVAPTPLAAQCLARAGSEDGLPVCRHPVNLREMLSPLPVETLGLSDAHLATLETLGVRRLAALFALPVAGLARRFGSALPTHLAQALGETPDLRQPFVFPEEFEQGLELPAKVTAADMLLFAARRLLAALAGWLAARVAGVSRCILRIEHDDELPASNLLLAFASPTRDLARMQRVLTERLSHFALPAPAVGLALQADTPQPLAGSTPGLFGDAATTALEPVIERLRARLGDAAVHGLALQADHRPECVSRSIPTPQLMPETSGPPRPLWLLPSPQALPEIDGCPSRDGALLRLAGPERIESGWWDDGERDKQGDVRRDYYVAMSPRGEWLWIFRDGGGWWLQGLFA
jgi:protein ImuB